MAIECLNDGFQFALLLGQLIEVSIRVGIGGIDLVQTGQGALEFAHCLFHGLTYGLLRIQFRLLRQVTDLDAGLWTGFTFDFGVDTSHDAEQGGFTGTIQTQHTDLGTREEGERNVFQNVPFGRNHLAHTVHGVNKLSHKNLNVSHVNEKFPILNHGDRR